MKRLKFNHKGFTLMELLVVVVIVAVLAGVAVPKYKKATLKARFSTVIPMAKAIADAQEVYYQGRQMYALDVDELDVTPIVTENVSITLSPTEGYDYVMAQHSQVPGVRYIIYQKYSENYPGEIHCEAAEENDDARWLCGVLSNNNDNIGQTVIDGYLTYLMEGTGAGLPVGAGNDDGGVSCSAAEAMGLSCNITTNEAGEQVKQICTNGICRTKTYNEDGSYTSVTCAADSNGVCTGNWYSTTYDENGNKTSVRKCSTIASDGTCSAYASGYYSGNYEYTYDADGNKTSERTCSTVASNGTCSAYSITNAKDYTYDENGNLVSLRYCSTVASDGTCPSYSATGSFDYTYDANGNMTSQRKCGTFASDGTCSSYSSGSDAGNYNYTYDANGNMTSKRKCTGFASDGTCNTYDDTSSYDYYYDTNGNLIFQWGCYKFESDGTCNEYRSGATLYTYDANGNQLTEEQCRTVASVGVCATYNSYAFYYTYDENGNRISSRYCGNRNQDGTCKRYYNTDSYDYTYDANGNMVSQLSCSDGACSSYSSANYYVYDDNGNQIGYKTCSGSNINTTTGECTAYNSTSVQNY